MIIAGGLKDLLDLLASATLYLCVQDEEYCCIHSSANTNSVLLLRGELCTTNGLVQLVSLQISHIELHSAFA